MKAREKRRSKPRYPIPIRILLRITFAVLLRRKRNFRDDALVFVAGLNPPLKIYGNEWIPIAGPALITINHYFRPGFRAWWLTLAVSGAVPAHIHWISTAAWTFNDRPFGRYFADVTHWLFHRLANVYGFITMPPMPPRQHEVEARANSVRRVLALVKSSPSPIIGFAPEGRDSTNGDITKPPSGVGRFVVHLSRLGLRIVPVGVFEEEGCFCLRFGEPYQIEPRSNLTSDELDRITADIVMHHIAELLPSHLRGEYEI